MRELLSLGHHVKVLARGRVSPVLLPDSVAVYHGDLCSNLEVSKAVAGVDVVFHLAAKLHLPNPTREMRGEYERVNVEGTWNLVDAARRAGVQRLVFFSTIAVYGPTGPEPVDETETPNPGTVYARTKLDAERIVLSAKAASGEPLGVVLRMAAVYGPRMKGNYVSLANALARGRFLPVGNGSNLRTLVYDRDAVMAAILAAHHPMAAGRIYNVSDGTVHSLREIIAAICAALGRRSPRAFVPLPAARLAAKLADAGLTLSGRPPRMASAVDKFVESAAVRADRIREELGFHPDYDLERGWKETVAGMVRSRGD